MIVVDSSAVVAVLLGEPEAPMFQTVLAGGEPCVMSAVNVHETATVLRLRHGMAAVDRLWRFLADAGIATVPFDAAQVRVAAQAFDRYGKGRSFPGAPEPVGLRGLRLGQDSGCAVAVQGQRLRAHRHCIVSVTHATRKLSAN